MQTNQALGIRIWEIPSGWAAANVLPIQAIEVARGGSSGFGEIPYGTAVEFEAIRDAVARRLSDLDSAKFPPANRLLDSVPEPMSIALDVALTDSHARSLGQPLYELLGGKARSTVPCSCLVDYSRDSARAAAQLERIVGDALSRTIFVRLDEDSAEETLDNLCRVVSGAWAKIEFVIDCGGSISAAGLQRLRPLLAALTPSLIVDPSGDMEETLAIGRSAGMGSPIGIGAPISGPRTLARALLMEGASTVVIDPHRWSDLRSISEALAVCRAFSVNAILRALTAGPSCCALLQLCVTDPWTILSAALPVSAIEGRPVQEAPGHINVADCLGHGFDPAQLPGARVIDAAGWGRRNEDR